MSNLLRWVLSGGVAASLRGLRGGGGLQKFGGVLGANAFSSLASFLIIIYAARAFEPAQFGKLALAISITTLLALVLDFGLNITLVRVYNIAASPEEGAGYIRAILGLKFFVLLALIPLALVLQEITTEALPTLSGYGGLTYLAFISGGLLSLWFTVRAVEQAQRDFRSLSLYTFVYGIFRFLSIGGLLLFYEASPISVFGALYTMPLVVLLLYSWFSKYRSFWLATAAHAYSSSVSVRLRKVFTYSIWVAVASICFNISSSLPQFVLARLGNEEEVGLYGAALAFLAVFWLMNDAIRKIILPDVTALRTTAERLEFRRRILRLSPVFFGIALPSLGFMAFVQYSLLGGTYAASVTIFVVLGLATIVTFYLGILNTLVHSHGVPRVEARNSLVRVVVLVPLLLLVPKTALSMSLTFASVLVAGELAVYIIIRHMDVRSDLGDSE